MKLFFIFFLLLFFAFGQTKAQDLDTMTKEQIFNMELEDLLKIRVNVATKTEQSIEDAPSVVTVITQVEIRAMGARELTDILQLVPGFELSKNSTGSNLIGVRGTKDPRFPCKILILMDGRPINDLFYGGANHYGYEYDIENIERIEIIRGSGSAVYGRNAFSAVINIISKTESTEKGVRAKAQVGTFNTYSGRLAYGAKSGELSYHVASYFLKTDGTDALNPNTNQTWGSLKENNQIFNANLKYKGLKFFGTFRNHQQGDWQKEAEGRIQAGYYMLEYDYVLNEISHLKTRVYGQNVYHIEDIGIVKPNATLPLGMYVTPKWKEYLYGSEIESTIHLSKQHDVLVGIHADVYGTNDAIILTNFDLSTGKVYQGIGHDNQIKYEKGWVVNNGHQYNSFAVYAQDVFHPIEKIGITLGGRYDYEKLIGGVFSPRVGLVYNAIEKGYFKLLYSSAYRSPATSQQYQTSGFSIGNANLKPERIQSLESSFTYQFEKMTSSVNVFYNQLTDMIYAEKYITPNVTKTAKNRNMGKNTAMGVEVEHKVVFKKVNAFVNYTYTISKNTDNFWDGSSKTYDHVDVAPHKFNANVSYIFSEKVKLNTNLMYRSKMKKFFTYNSKTQTYSDISQDPIGDYAIVNSTLRLINFIKGFEISASVYNILNTNYYAQEASLIHSPQQGNRQFIVGVGYQF